MKMVMLCYNEAIDDEVMETLQGCELQNYTKVVAVFGKGTTSGTHLGNDIWPGRNNILYIACEDATAKKLLCSVGDLRKQLGMEGIKAFAWKIEEVTQNSP
ncbi:MAG: hypothetical protein NTZ78_10400 [Candidatus Aureabacteria bacterium]|nr:hypothetical protein [Candidatus Auribacterota bacterium]